MNHSSSAPSPAVSPESADEPPPALALGASSAPDSAATESAELEPLPLHRGACELKYVVDAKTAASIRDWAREHLQPDPHASSECPDGYRVNNLYLDTPAFDVFHRTPKTSRRKFRVRRYGSEPLLWLEEKRKRQGCVHKRRVLIDERELGERLFGPPNVEWTGVWFRRKLEKRVLLPTCRVTYRRFARVLPTASGPLRLTIDDELRTAPADGWLVPTSPVASDCLLGGRFIVELKFVGTMPSLYRDLVERLKLALGSFSKYRTSAAFVVPDDVLKTGRPTPGAFHA